MELSFRSGASAIDGRRTYTVPMEDWIKKSVNTMKHQLLDFLICSVAVSYYFELQFIVVNHAVEGDPIQ